MFQRPDYFTECYLQVAKNKWQHVTPRRHMNRKKGCTSGLREIRSYVVACRVLLVVQAYSGSSRPMLRSPTPLSDLCRFPNMLLYPWPVLVS